MEIDTSMAADMLQTIFSDDLIEKLRTHETMNKDLSRRIAVLEINRSGPKGNFSEGYISHLNKKNTAWESYLTAAYDIGLFDKPHGKDLTSRLRSSDPENFRSAMAECMAAWYLNRKLNLNLELRPKGRNLKTLEFCIKAHDGEIYSEVKAPYSVIDEGPLGPDGSDLLRRALESASNQFRSGVRNLLIIAPEFTESVFYSRGQLSKAFFGNIDISYLINNITGDRVGDFSIEFKRSGHFLIRNLPSGRFYKPDGSPRFTRVSAVLCIEEINGEKKIEHNVLVIHNPYAKHRIAQNVWGNIPQFPWNNKLQWSDGVNPWLP